MPTGWVATIMGPTAVLLTLGSVYGYQRWLLRNGVPPPQLIATPAEITLFTIVLAIPTWAAAYLLWHGSAGTAVMVALTAAAIAVFGLRRFKQRSKADGNEPTRATALSPLAASPLLFFKVIMLGFTAYLPLTIAGALIVQGEAVIGAVIAILTLPVLFWVVRRIRACLLPR
jgi:hypothetical protein